MAIAVPEEVVDTLGSARVQTPAPKVDWLGTANVAREVDNTSSQTARNATPWHGAHPQSLAGRWIELLTATSVVIDWLEVIVSRNSRVATPTALQVMVDALARISYASELPEGWFERGSVGLSDRARKAATEFVYLLAVEGLLAKDTSLDVIPTPIGGIQFEWAGKNGEIEVEIDAQGRFYTLVERSDGSMYETPRSQPVSAIMVLPHIERVLA